MRTVFGVAVAQIVAEKMHDRAKQSGIVATSFFALHSFLQNHDRAALGDLGKLDEI